MRICLGDRNTGRVYNVVDVVDIDSAAALYPDFDCVPMDDTHPAEPDATYSRRAGDCRVTRNGVTRDVPRTQCRLGR